MGPRRSLHAFGSQEIGQPREEHLPCLGGVGRRTHDLCCKRKSRHREALRAHLGVGGLGTFFPECRFCSQHLPSGHEGGAVAVDVRARLPSLGPSQLSASLQPPQAPPRRAPSLFPSRSPKCAILQIDESWNRRERLCPATPDAGHFAGLLCGCTLIISVVNCPASATPHNVCIKSLS